MAHSVAVAVSGGIDSLYALVSLQEQGHSVMAIHAYMHGEAHARNVEALEEMCVKLDVPLHCIDIRSAFATHVVDPFVAAYAAGQTPNPCALCNKHIKFGVLRDAAMGLGATHFATGHYVKLVEHPQYGQVLQNANDVSKDQAYFLALTPHEQLENTYFPLATITKTEARNAIAKRGLAVPIPTESQDICFIPKEGYQTFLREQGVPVQEGAICLQDGKILGTHKGLWQYTEGQRKGLGIGWKEPLYVLRKDMQKNLLFVGTQTEFSQNTVCADNIICHVPKERWPKALFVRIRYRQEAQKALVSLENNTLIACFETPQNHIAKGQVMAVYDAEKCMLAAGIIL